MYTVYILLGVVFLCGVVYNCVVVVLCVLFLGVFVVFLSFSRCSVSSALSVLPPAAAGLSVAGAFSVVFSGAGPLSLSRAVPVVFCFRFGGAVSSVVFVCSCRSVAARLLLVWRGLRRRRGGCVVGFCRSGLPLSVAPVFWCAGSSLAVSSCVFVGSRWLLGWRCRRR